MFRVGFLIVFLAAGCTSSGHWYFEKESYAPPAEWSYEGDTGPAHWGELSPAYAAATNGREQSPINIVTAKANTTGTSGPKFHYRNEKVGFVNNGHTLEHEEGEGSWFEWKGKRYALAQFHFHTPSEHTIDGKRSAMEVHLVHKGPGGKVLVLSAMVNEGEGNEGIEEACRHLPGQEEMDCSDMPTVNLVTFLPKDHGCYHYTGSFTTPPCTEGVSWLILKQPITAPASVVARFRKAMGKNNRPTQPQNDRVVDAGN